MVLEELTFMLESGTNSFVVVDVALTSVDHWDISKS